MDSSGFTCHGSELCTLAVSQKSTAAYSCHGSITPSDQLGQGDNADIKDDHQLLGMNDADDNPIVHTTVQFTSICKGFRLGLRQKSLLPAPSEHMGLSMARV